MVSEPLRRLRRQRLVRRVVICVVALGLIAVTAAGLVWLLETFRTYDPKYYEPKDIERERYEMQQRTSDSKSNPGRP